MRRFPAVLLALAAAAALTVAMTGAPALADGPVIGPFGLTPVPAGGQPRSYFTMRIAPGHAAADSATVSNESRRTERLRLTVSRGVTAANSGSAYEAVTGRCSGSDCWIRGLPRTVTLAPGTGERLPFRVSVPRGTQPGQYLAGLTVESAVRPRPVRVGGNRRTSARAIIIDQVTVGVAVTVGTRLRTGLTAGPVQAGWIGATPRLYIPVHDTGQTFLHATGRVTCTSGGQRHGYRVLMETVLPGGRAVLPVNARGLASGTLPCTVRLSDGGPRPVTWTGNVMLSAAQRTRIYHPARGVYVSLPASTIPPWAIALLVLGALILLLYLSRRFAPQAGRSARSRRFAPQAGRFDPVSFLRRSGAPSSLVAPPPGHRRAPPHRRVPPVTGEGGASGEAD